MSIYIDRQYLSTISHKLDRFSQKSPDLYNFRCPLCGDSRKNKGKARGYIYRKGNDFFYRCHNCSAGTTFSNFLKGVDESVHKQYVLEKFMNGAPKNAPVEKPNFDELKGNAFARFAKTSYTPSIQSITELPQDHYAVDYIRNRMIPSSRWGDIYFTENFRMFMDLDFPDHGKENLPEDSRIVFFYRDEDRNVNQVAGRAMADSKLRYITVKVKDGVKAYGLERIDKSKRVYIVEGQFDSLFLDNAIASGDSNLTGTADALGMDDVVLVYDNEPRNKEIVKQIERAVNGGYTICLFPEQVKGKDINEMIQNGLTAEEIRTIIDKFTASGLTARMDLYAWRKC